MPGSPRLGQGLRRRVRGLGVVVKIPAYVASLHFDIGCDSTALLTERGQSSAGMTALVRAQANNFLAIMPHRGRMTWGVMFGLDPDIFFYKTRETRPVVVLLEIKIIIKILSDDGR